MFNNDFFPTPAEVIEKMLFGQNIEGKVIFEPSAGKGNIINYLVEHGAKEVIAAEINNDLRKILQTKCKLIADDFLKVTSDQISHIDLIVMNPPFSADDKHILHAYNIAPQGCTIISLCNNSTIKNTYTSNRKELATIVENYGQYENLGDCFANAERQTSVTVGLIKIKKPGESYQTEFEGFFLEEDQEEQENGIIEYNVIRDLVNRYVEAVKIYDRQLQEGAKMNELLHSFYGETLTFTCTLRQMPVLRNEFKKNLQKSGWKFIFDKLDLEKWATKGLKEDINKFIEQQTQVPFTMRNIYKMLEIIVGTNSQRMDKALLEVFDKITAHHHDNRHYLTGWKTNSHYLVNQTFILPNMCAVDKWNNGPELNTSYGGYFDFMEDMVKALCFITGDNYEKYGSLYSHVRYAYKVQTEDKVYYYSSHEYNNAIRCVEGEQAKGRAATLENKKPYYGEWFEWAFFEVKAFKKGTMHFKFKDPDLWGKFNQRIAKLKGYPLFEGKEQTAYQKKQTGRTQAKTPPHPNPTQHSVLFEFNL